MTFPNRVDGRIRKVIDRSCNPPTFEYNLKCKPGAGLACNEVGTKINFIVP